jgi:hypothetical protein
MRTVGAIPRYDATNAPAAGSSLWQGAVSVRETPAFAWRHSNNANNELQEHVNFSIALGDNNDGGTQDYTSQDVHKPGGGVRFASPPGFVHTSLVLVRRSARTRQLGEFN